MEIIRAEIRSIAGICYILKHEEGNITYHAFANGETYAEWGNKGVSIPYTLKKQAEELIADCTLEPVQAKNQYVKRKHTKSHEGKYINKANMKKKRERVL